MSGRVDVLAVMEGLCSLAFDNMPTRNGGQSYEGTQWTDACAARAAVEELIDQREEVRADIEQALGWLSGTNPTRTQNIESVRRILRTALARIGGDK